MKKHCLLLGKAGLIYNSWLLDVLFIAFIIGYESNRSISWPAIAVGAVFAAALLYSFLTCYLSKEGEQTKIRLPYQRKAQTIESTKLLFAFSMIHIYQAKLSDYKQLTYLVLEKN
ncbi:MAG: hypothetical protein LKF01_06670 [Lactobacillus sp.]|jgi:hypothetical protein|nr:hypothetical protein [Lactobacillus sp.]MCH4069153.1 hypothetical protein [Lactobacillus sp.]MCI1303860.1 hypothetical protein [Lactobacillus sp.]MCI1329631.1 hypothetical protein [Lactobacillus sp.]MCI1359873.1 hypothetical protein [Lactobacillus sp.]